MNNHPDNKLKILHLIPNLNTGGAEVLLSNLVLSLNKSNFINTVVCLKSGGSHEARLRKHDINVLVLSFHGFLGILSGVFKLIKIFLKIKPDILQCWMYHSNLIGGLIGKFLGIKKIFWSIHSNMPDDLSSMTKLMNKFSARFSNFIPSRIIFVSEASLTKHIKYGYSKNRSLIISNGIDTQRFNFSDNLRSEFRNRNQISQNEFTIGMLGRYTSEKDYPNFFKSLRDIESQDIKILLAGTGINYENDDFTQLIDKYASAFKEKIRLLDEVHNTVEFFSGIDLFVISSNSESAPVSLIEAMSMSRMIVVTDVGDCKHMLNNDDYLCKSKSPKCLADKINQSINLNSEERNLIGDLNRRRAINLFSHDQMTANYKASYTEAIK